MRHNERRRARERLVPHDNCTCALRVTNNVMISNRYELCLSSTSTEDDIESKIIQIQQKLAANRRNVHVPSIRNCNLHSTYIHTSMYVCIHVYEHYKRPTTLRVHIMMLQYIRGTNRMSIYVCEYKVNHISIELVLCIKMHS